MNKPSKTFDLGIALNNTGIILIGYALSDMRKRKKFANDKTLQKALTDLLKKMEPVRKKIQEIHLREVMEQIDAAMQADCTTNN